jgi:hypothetical protein
MPRAKKAAPVLTDSTVGDEAARSLHGELVNQQDRALEEIDNRFGIGQPYDLDRYIDSARDAVGVISGRLFVIGRILISIKEHEGHGGFLAALERIGIAPRFAQRCMVSVVKFEGSDAKRLVGARLSHGKLLELLAEEGDDIEALGEGGTLAGLTLDDIDKMSTTELRAELRKTRKDKFQDAAAHEEILARKDEKINKLELKVRKAGKLPLRERGEELLAEALRRLSDLIGAAENLNLAIEELKAIHNDANEELPGDIANQVDHIADTVDFHANALRTSCEA